MFFFHSSTRPSRHLLVALRVVCTQGLCFPLGWGILKAQSFAVSGQPIHRSWLVKEYFAHEQNWSIARDAKGLLYVGNNLGVLEYDGANLRLITLPSIVRSLDVTPEGIVCVGAKGDLGYLRPDSTGRQSFNSLREQLPPEAREFTNVWKTYATSEGVNFHTLSHLFRWSGDAVKVWKPEESFGYILYYKRVNL